MTNMFMVRIMYEVGWVRKAGSSVEAGVYGPDCPARMDSAVVIFWNVDLIVALLR